MTYSNMASTKRPMSFNGSKAKWMSCQTPSMGDWHFGVTFLTMADTMRVCLFGDYAFIENPEELMQILEEEIQKMTDQENSESLIIAKL